MSKAKKIWLITAICLILIGGIVFGGVMVRLKWDFTKLSTHQYETTEHIVTESFHAISVHTDTAGVSLLPSEDGKCRVVCYEQENVKHSVSVADGVLTVDVVDTRKWYEHIGINFGTPKITVYLPENEYSSLMIEEKTGDVEIPNDFKFESIDISVSTGYVECSASATEAIKIKTTTGGICVANLSAGLLDLSVSTGKVTASGIRCDGEVRVRVSTGKTVLTDVACQSVISSGSTGNIILKNVIAAGKFSIERSTGDVKFDGADAVEIFVKTDTGDVEGSLLSDKVFVAKTDTGRIRVPSTTAGGRCEITTDTGNINITVK